MTSTATSRPARFGALLAPQLVTLGLVCIACAGTPLLFAALYHGLRGLLVDPYRQQAAALLRLIVADQNGFALFAVANGVLGLCHFALWVLFRERSLATATAWATAITFTGFGACRCEAMPSESNL